MQRPVLVRGHAVPALIYGTAWKEDRTEALTAAALVAGFRGIDTANQRKHYVEQAVGAALAAAAVPRSELFVQTKFTYARGQDHRLPYDPDAPIADQVAQSFARSLDHLRTTYVDSYLLHGPATSDGLADADVEAWRAMERIQAAGGARLLGISNASRDQLEQLRTIARVAPAFVQNRCYARTGWDAEVRAWCRAHGVVYQGFSLLTANRRELVRPAIDEIMARTGHSREQLVFAFARHVGMIPLTGTSDPAHMREDLAATDLGLTAADAAVIEAIGA